MKNVTGQATADGQLITFIATEATTIRRIAVQTLVDDPNVSTVPMVTASVNGSCVYCVQTRNAWYTGPYKLNAGDEVSVAVQGLPRDARASARLMVDSA